MPGLSDVFGVARPGDYGIIGDPVAHSMSPAMQNAAFDWLWRTRGHSPETAPRYRLFPVAGADVPSALQMVREKGIAGINVTVPHKTAVLAHLDDLHAFAKSAGAVNTVRNVDGRLTGYNTDGLGFERAVSEDMAITPDVAFVLGAGGTGQVIVHQLLAMDVHRVYWWNRTPGKLEPLIQTLSEPDRVRVVDDEEIPEICSQSDLIVNATSVGLKEGDGLPAPGLAFSAEQGAFDVVYHRGTAFLKAAEAAGALACGGLPMLLHQGAAAFEVWTGENAPVSIMRKALDATLKEKGINPIWPSAI